MLEGYAAPFVAREYSQSIDFDGQRALQRALNELAKFFKGHVALV
jgi:hypothetical protein